MNGNLRQAEQSPSLILCVVDFSESSGRAVEWAAQMAQTTHAHVTVLHTFRLIQFKNGEVFAMKKRKEEEALIQFSAIENKLLYGKKISYDFKAEVGFITDRIESYASRNSILFLVIDKSICERNKESFEELLKNIHIPLVIIP